MRIGALLKGIPNPIPANQGAQFGFVGIQTAQFPVNGVALALRRRIDRALHSLSEDFKDPFRRMELRRVGRQANALKAQFSHSFATMG